MHWNVAGSSLTGGALAKAYLLPNPTMTVLIVSIIGAYVTLNTLTVCLTILRVMQMKAYIAEIAIDEATDSGNKVPRWLRNRVDFCPCCGDIVRPGHQCD